MMPNAISANLKYSRKNPQHDIELLKKIGSGTYGEVYQAKYIESQAETAVKIVKIDAGDDWAAIQQEVIILQECKHPNIVAYMGSYLSKERLWITMEYCSGGSVQDIYRVNGPLAELQIAFVSRETLKGLSYLHSRNTVHRDIKGANILLTIHGSVKLADFGISATITETLGKRKSFIGTPYWMAPEVAAVETKGGYDHMCDIWAVGITAIECAEMQPPFYEMHPMKMLYMMTKSNYRSPTLKQKNKWSTQFHSFLKDSLTKQPKKRPTADRLLYHPFVSQFVVSDILQSLVVGTQAQVEPEQEPEPEPPAPEPQRPAAPKRIASKKNIRKDKPNRPKDKVTSIIDQVQIPHPPPRTTSQQPASTTKDIATPEDDNNIYDDPWHSVDMLPPPPPQEEEFDNVDSNNADSGGDSDRDGTVRRAPDSAEGDGTLAAPPSRPPRPGDKPPAPAPLPPRRASPALPPAAPPAAAGAPPLPPRNPSISRAAPAAASTPSPARARFFTKIFSGCPLNINCAGVWTHPSKEHTYVLLGTEQGLYTLDTASRDDPTMIILSSKRVQWLHVFENWLLTISGDNTYMYSHNLLLLHENVKDEDRPVVRKKLLASTRLNETKGVKKACAMVNPFTRQYMCCVLTPASFLLFMWQAEKVKFECVKALPCPIQDYTPSVFEMIIRQDENFPTICVAIYQGDNNRLILEHVNLNGSSVWLGNHAGATPLSVNTLHQIEGDTVLVGFSKQAMFINREGVQKQSTRTRSALTYSVNINSLVCLEGGVLGFHQHGMEGRSLTTGRIEAEVQDESKVFRLLSSARMIILESRVAADTTNNSNLYVLTSAKNE